MSFVRDGRMVENKGKLILCRLFIKLMYIDKFNFSIGVLCTGQLPQVITGIKRKRSFAQDLTSKMTSIVNSTLSIEERYPNAIALTLEFLYFN